MVIAKENPSAAAGDDRPRFRNGPPFTKRTFLDLVPGDFVATELGYAGGRCLLDQHRSHPSSNYLWRSPEPELIYYRCWPCDAVLNAFDLLRATISGSGFEGDLEAETMQRAEEIAKRWRDTTDWEADETQFTQGSGSWTDLGGGSSSGWTPPLTTEEMTAKLEAADDPAAFARALEVFGEDRAMLAPSKFDSFHLVPANFIISEFGWRANIYQSFLVPLRDEQGHLVNIRHKNARQQRCERGHEQPALYGLERLRDHKRVVIVEGIPDTVRMAWELRKSPETVVVGLTSAAFAVEKIPTEVFAGREVVILGDGDDAGRRAVQKLAGELAVVAAVSIVPQPAGYSDVCAYEGDLVELLETAKPYEAPHYLERPDVLAILNGITAGMALADLERLLRQLPPLPSDALTVTVIRDEIAERLKAGGFSAKVADGFIKSAPKEEDEREFEQVADKMAPTQLWPTEVDGIELLEQVRAAIKRFVFLPHEEVYDVLAVWVLGTFIFEHFPTTVYLHVTAPAMMSGKTRVLEILEEFCRRALLAGGVSAAVLYRAVEMFRPTLLIDEADTIFTANSESGEAIRGVLNNGYTRGKPIFRMVPNPDGTQTPVPFDPYCPKALAGIGRIPDTVSSRSITITMVRKKNGEEAERYARRQREALHAEALEWKRKAERWVADHAAEFDLDPTFPAGLSDRAQDCWEPLLVIAELISDDLASRLRAAAVMLNAQDAVRGSEELADMLLEDLAELLDSGMDRSRQDIATSELLTWLNGLLERPWPHLKNGKGLNGVMLAKMMTSFDISPCKIRDNKQRGYFLGEIERALERWL